jgi:hypothetical protein
VVAEEVDVQGGARHIQVAVAVEAVAVAEAQAPLGRSASVECS